MDHPVSLNTQSWKFLYPTCTESGSYWWVVQYWCSPHVCVRSLWSLIIVLSFIVINLDFAHFNVSGLKLDLARMEHRKKDHYMVDWPLAWQIRPVNIWRKDVIYIHILLRYTIEATHELSFARLAIEAVRGKMYSSWLRGRGRGGSELKLLGQTRLQQWFSNCITQCMNV